MGLPAVPATRAAAPNAAAGTGVIPLENTARGSPTHPSASRGLRRGSTPWGGGLAQPARRRPCLPAPRNRPPRPPCGAAHRLDGIDAHRIAPGSADAHEARPNARQGAQPAPGIRARPKRGGGWIQGRTRLERDALHRAS